MEGIIRKRRDWGFSLLLRYGWNVKCWDNPSCNYTTWCEKSIEPRRRRWFWWWMRIEEDQWCSWDELKKKKLSWVLDTSRHHMYPKSNTRKCSNAISLHFKPISLYACFDIQFHFIIPENKRALNDMNRKLQTQKVACYGSRMFKHTVAVLYSQMQWDSTFVKSNIHHSSAC